MNNYLRSFISKVDYLRNNTKIMVVLFSIFTIMMSSAFLLYQNAISFEVYLNDEMIAVVQNKSTILETMSTVEKQVEEQYGNEAKYAYDIRLKKVIGDENQLVGQMDLQGIIHKNLEVYKPAAIIMVDGDEKLVVETRIDAEMVLESIKAPFLDKIQKENTNADILAVNFSQQVEIVEKDVLIERITPSDKALDEINVSKEQLQTYKIASGDSAWQVSRSFNTSINNLEEANPDKDMEDLMPGDVINLVVEKPFIDVTTTIKKTVSEKIDYKTVKEETDSLYIGQSKVKQQGIKGEKEVTKEITFVNGEVDAEKVLDEKIISEPTEKILLVGTKKRPVSSYSGKAAPTYNGDLGSSIVATAKHYLGLPYRSGGSTPAGFDCSGFTSYVYRQYGIYIPRTSSGQGSVGGYVAKSDLRAGDLVVFSGHVGIYVGNNRFIHSPRPGKSVQISSLSESYWRSTYRSGRRVY